MPRKKRTDRDGVTQRPDGFYISYIDSQGIRRWEKLRGCISLTEAKRLRNLKLAAVTEAIATGKPPVSEELFSEIVPAYLTYQQGRLKPKSYERTSDVLLKHLVPVFAVRKGDIINFLSRRATIQAQTDGKKKRVSRPPARSTIIKELNVLRHLYNWALEQEKVAVNPCHGVKGPRPAPGRLRYLQPAELKNVLQACPSWLQPIVGLLSFTGCRRSEILGLRWMDIDRLGGRLLLPQTKNGDGRVIWLNDLAGRVLDSLPKTEHKPTDRVFDGYTPENVSLAFLRACRRCNVADFRLHDLRHTAASWLAMSGADIHLVAQMLGHRDLRMAARYRHLSPTFLQNAAKRLDVAFGPELEALPMLNPSHDGNTIEHENVPKSMQTSAN